MNDAALNDYLTAIGKIPLLTHEEEIILGRAVQAWMADKDSDNPCPRIARRGMRAKERMVSANLRLVVSVSKRFMYRTHTLSRMDLIQEGNLGLIRGVEKFDPERGYRGSTYFYWWIRQGIARAIGQSDRMIRLPGAAGDVLHKVRRFIADETNLTGKAPTLEQCAAFANVPVNTLEIYLSHAAGHKSLDAQAKNQDDNGCAILDLLPGTSTNTVEEAWNSMELDRLQCALDTSLTEIERDVIDKMYGLTTGEPVTLEKVGRARGTSRESVRQAKERALRKIRVTSAKLPLLA